jgi:tripartite-type tricarboxylate transporter receptor subunit TctC
MTKTHRRGFLHLAAGAGLLLAKPSFAIAQAYPTKPVRIISPFAAGGGNDVIARLIAQWLSERLGQPFIVENRTGASGNLGADAVAKAAPDGYTLLLFGAPAAINATLYGNLSFSLTRDIAPVASIMRVPNVMEINPAVPAKTVPEFIVYAKSRPGKLNMASAGSGTSIHLAGELFMMMTGVELLHVPYRGSAPALTDLISGQMHVMFDVVTTSLQHIRAGSLRALAVTTTARSDELPDVPAASEFVPGYESSGWYGIGAPKNTPLEIVGILNREINAGLADLNLKARLVALSGAPIQGSPADFGKLVEQETEKWGKVIRAANIKVK